jgi:hypothetical protein
MLSCTMDCRVKPGNDGKTFVARRGFCRVFRCEDGASRLNIMHEDGASRLSPGNDEEKIRKSNAAHRTRFTPRRGLRRHAAAAPACRRRRNRSAKAGQVFGP